MRKSNQPLPYHIPDFLDWLEIEKGLSPKSQENYHSFLKKFLIWLAKNKLEKIKPHQLTPEHLWRYRLFLSRQTVGKKKEPLKRSTQNHYLIALRSLLTYFTQKDILALPPEKVSLPKEKEKEIVRFLTLEQIERLLASPDPSSKVGLRDRAILETFFSTGLRVAELVNLDREQIRIRPTTKTLEISITGKGGHPRTVYFSERAILALRDYLTSRNDKTKALFINYHGRKPLTRLSIKGMERIVKKYAVAEGLPVDTSCHTLRHSFASDLLRKGVDLRIIQEFLGHRNIATTQRYAHVTKPHLKEIHRKFHGKTLRE